MLTIFGLPPVLAVLLASRGASRRPINPSLPGLAANAARLLVLPSTTSAVALTVIAPAAKAAGAGAMIRVAISNSVSIALARIKKCWWLIIIIGSFDVHKLRGRLPRG